MNDEIKNVDNVDNVENMTKDEAKDYIQSLIDSGDFLSYLSYLNQARKKEYIGFINYAVSHKATVRRCKGKKIA